MSKSRLRPGRLGSFVAGYRVCLLERGYAPGTVKHELGFLSALGRWMIDQGLRVEQLDSGVVDGLVDVLRAAGWRSSIARRPRSLLIYLRELGVIEAEPRGRLSPLEELIEWYREWLLVERGLAAIAVVRYAACARRFLDERTRREDELGVKDLRGEHVTAFLLRECERLSVGSAKGRVGELRSLPRYLFQRGLTPLALADSVPQVAGWRVATHASTARRQCPSLDGKQIHPHVLRHSCAMSLLQAGVDTTVIALWLGHADVRSTQPYLHADLPIKEQALALVTPAGIKPGRYKPPDKLLAFFEGL